MATAHEIRVFAMFPSPDPSRWDWVHCLTFPLHTINELQFTQKKHYKWIRYATGVVVGAHGYLSRSRNSPDDLVNYNVNPLPDESADLFYHITDAERRRMFPADPDMGRTNVTSSELTSRRAQFRRDIVARDGVCVLTGFREGNCDAAHLLPHSKGDQYIETYTQHRSRDPDENDIVDEIGDVRNGILLNKIAHGNFGKHIAFLITPNFAMDTADVDPIALPAEKRCIAHLFVPDEPEHFGDRTLPSGSLVHMPNTVDEWPPDILFDAVYANAVLRHFAPRTVQDTLRQWRATFFPGEGRSRTQANYRVMKDTRAAEDRRRRKQKRARQERAARREEAGRVGDDYEDYFDYLMILPYILIPPEEQAAIWRKAAEEKAERERAWVEDKVEGWRKKLEDVCP